MREERIVRSFSSALTALAVLVTPLYLLGGLGLTRTMLLYGAGCALIGITAALALGSRHPALQISPAALTAAALALLLPLQGGPFVRYVAMGAGALLAVWTERLAVTARSLKPGLVLAPLVALVISSAVLWFAARGFPDSPALWPMLLLLFAAWFAVAVVLLNRMSLRQAAHAADGAGIPVAVRRRGMAGAALFAVAAMLLASIGSIASFIGNAVRALILWAIDVFAWLSSLFTPPVAESQDGQPPGQQDMLPQADGTPSPLAELITNILIAVVLIAVSIGILYALYKYLPKLWNKLRDRLHLLFAGWRADDGFQDRTESLLSLKQAAGLAGDRFRRFVRRFRRKPRLSDFPTNADRARFLFREFLRGLIAAKREPAPGTTATEIARPAPALARAYNLARYGEGEPEDHEIEKARDEMNF